METTMKVLIGVFVLALIGAIYGIATEERHDDLVVSTAPLQEARQAISSSGDLVVTTSPSPGTVCRVNPAESAVCSYSGGAVRHLSIEY